MKLSVSKDEIQEKLSNIQNIVEKRNTMPVLSHFLLSAGKKDSYIVATDLETALKEPLQVKVEKEGRLCIPARKLFEIVREVDGDLSFESTDEQWLRVKAGVSDFRLACLSANEFPAWPGMEEVENIVVEAKTLMDMIEKTIYSAGESDTRYTLNGLLFHIKPEEVRLTIVGTDGHRLASINKQIEGEVKDEKKMIVPRKAASELRRFLDGEVDKVKISMGRNHVLFSIGDVQFLTRLIEGTYPNYEQVIPVANEKKVSIGRDAFTKALRRVSIMSKERSNAIKFDLTEDVITLSSSSPDLGEARDEVVVDYKGDKLSVGFNARYLLDVIGVMTSERVILELQDPLSPVILKEEGDEDYRCVIMPMRI
ncbi:MAG: DNA polymerase III subunit beta [Nitrospirae bacterium]|nr:DNA polymerase III subunit beta [Nitrospirota bacterium]